MTAVVGGSVATVTLATVPEPGTELLLCAAVRAGIGGDVASAAVTLAAVVAILEHILVLSIVDGEQNVVSLSALGEEISTCRCKNVHLTIITTFSQKHFYFSAAPKMSSDKKQFNNIKCYLKTLQSNFKQ